MKDLEPLLAQHRAKGLYRRRRVSDGPQGPEMRVDGRYMLAFCSNDYLGLANHPRVIEAMQAGAREYGAGSGAAHLINGHSRAHHQLEEELAAFTGRPRALLFSTGYMANQGVIAALLGRGDHVIEDRLNHASLIDGATLSRARLHRFAHSDMAALEGRLSALESGEKLIAVDGVFSMDGDLALLTELAEAALRHDAWLMVDDAHGIGVLGEQGRGSLDAAGLGMEQAPILMATLGKGLGVFGAFVAGSEALIETLIQRARSYIFTTALPPAVAEATRAALRISQKEEWRRENLFRLIRRFREGAESLGLPLMASPTPIQPLLAGSAETALAWSARLEQAGLLVTAIRPPTVPEGASRLRITLSAAHSDAQLERLLDALSTLPIPEATP
jgi:8-amino-7-oxononanoate synthase